MLIFFNSYSFFIIIIWGSNNRKTSFYINKLIMETLKALNLSVTKALGLRYNWFDFFLCNLILYFVFFFWINMIFLIYIYIFWRFLHLFRILLRSKWGKNYEIDVIEWWKTMNLVHFYLLLFALRFTRVSLTNFECF